MNRKLKVGILGGEGILAAHAPGFMRLMDKCEVVVAESDLTKHAGIKRLLGEDVRIYGDYTEVLALEAIQAV